MSRELTLHKVNGLNEHLQIVVADEPGQGGACHNYDIHLLADPSPDTPKITAAEGFLTQRIRFQNGPIKEAGVNGISQEALLAIVEDRLRSFQAGHYACQDNAEALFHVTEAMRFMQKRTKERMARGVEGTSQK